MILRAYDGLVSRYPAELSTVSVALDLLKVESDPRLTAAVKRETEFIDPAVAAVDYVSIDWDAVERTAESDDERRRIALARGLLDGEPDEGGLWHLVDGTYSIVGTIRDGRFQVDLERTTPRDEAHPTDTD